MKPSLLVISLIFLVPNIIKAQSDKQTVAEKIKLVEDNILPNTRVGDNDAPINIKERMAFYKVKGATIAVIHNYKLEWVKGYGWADDSLKLPVTTATLFQVGSISKSLNGMGVLKLVQERKLDLYVDINNYLTSWKFPYDSVSQNKKITMANLLSHTGGLNMGGFSGYKPGKPLPTLPQILDGLKPAISQPIRSIYAPGLKHEYSTGGTMVAQQVVMDITHQPYDKYMDDAIFKPLGMTSTTFTQPVKVSRALLATGYNKEGRQISGKNNIFPEQAGAGLWTNTSDLSKFIIEVQLALQGKSHKVINQQTATLMLTPYLNREAALGVFVVDFGGEKYFLHNGGVPGTTTRYFGSVQGGNGIIVFINSDNATFMDEVVNSVASVYQFKGLNQSRTKQIVVVTDDVLQSYTGKYQIGPQRAITITKVNSQLYAEPSSSAQMAIYPQSQTKFFVKGIPVEIEFVKNVNGIVTKIIAYEGGRATDVKKVQ
jgi:CubicO group peptidase (beta-lactamase class C family)